MPDTTWPEVKLETNIPLVGIIKYADYWKGKDWTDPATNKTKRLPDQLGLKGNWAAPGQAAHAGRLFVGLAQISQLCGMGALTPRTDNDQYGNPRYDVNGQRPIRFLKKEGERNTKPVTVSWAEESEGAQGAPATTPAARPAAPAPAQRAKAAVAQVDPKAARSLKTATEIEREAALQLLKSAKAARYRLAEFAATFEACAAAAHHVTTRLLLDWEISIEGPALAFLVEKVAMHLSIQMAQEHQHVVTRERYEELRTLAGVPDTKPKPKPQRPAAPPPAAPVSDADEDAGGKVKPLNLDAFDEGGVPDDDDPY